MVLLGGYGVTRWLLWCCYGVYCSSRWLLWYMLLWWLLVGCYVVAMVLLGGCYGYC